MINGYFIFFIQSKPKLLGRFLYVPDLSTIKHNGQVRRTKRKLFLSLLEKLNTNILHHWPWRVFQYKLRWTATLSGFNIKRRMRCLSTAVIPKLAKAEAITQQQFQNVFCTCKKQQVSVKGHAADSSSP